LKLKVRNRQKGPALNWPALLFAIALVALGVYLALLDLHLGTAFPLIASIASSGSGLFLGLFSLGYPSLILLVALGVGAVILWNRRRASVTGFSFGAAVIVGLLLGASFTLIPPPPPYWLHTAEDSSGGFTLTVS